MITVQNLLIPQGHTYFMSFVWANDPAGTQPVDLTNATIRMQIRRAQQQTLMLEARSDGDAPMITHGGDTGLVEVTLTDEATTMLSSRKCKYDIEVTMPDGATYRMMQGDVTVDPNITQEAGEPIVR